MKKVSFLWLLGPLVCLIIIGIIVMIERAGIAYKSTVAKAVFLPEDFVASEPMDENIGTVLLYDSEYEISIRNKDAISFVLEHMDVQFDLVNLKQEEFPFLEDYQVVVFAIQNYEVIGDKYVYLTDWVKDGGRALIALSPEFTPVFEALYPKLGVQFCAETYKDIKGIRFVTDFMPGSKGLEFGDEAISGNCLALQVTEDAIKHIVTAGEEELPLLWEHNYGKGKFVVHNNYIFEYKDTRGILAAAYSLLEDVCVYPVINSSMYYIDDFPAPIPDGFYEAITEEYGRNIASFYQNIWWPDMLSLSEKYGIKYTGLLIETYNDKVIGPFTGAEEDMETFRNFGAMLMKNGGELGLHGYNHMPLCLEDFDYKGQLDYKKWPSKMNMKEAIHELTRFAEELFPENDYNTYVPPSNVLSTEGRAMLAENFPQIKVISGSYLPDYFYECEQEFNVGEDGIINVPRITAGCDVTPYMKWVAFNELSFHYVNSHFLHPDDVLDVERGADKGWEFMFQKFDEYIQWINSSAPGIRNMTASQGAAAVERYDNLSVSTSYIGNKVTISLGGFYDEAWLMVRLNQGKPGEVTGGLLEHVSGNLYLLKATNSTVIIDTVGMSE